MPKTANLLAQLSSNLAAQTLAAGPAAVAVGSSSGRHSSGMLWAPDVIVTSEQSLSKRGDYEVRAGGRPSVSATLAGRDPGTNIAVLRLAEPLPFESRATNAKAHLGAIALAVGADSSGAACVRLGIVSAVGPEWRSQSGGTIEQRIVLDMLLDGAEEGGPVVDAEGAIFGMSTLGSHGQTLVIPSATLERIVPRLLQDGRIPRGWLGIALQPIAVPDDLREAAGQGNGMMVMSVVDEGAGAKAGVLAGDILLALDGTPVGRRLGAALGADSVGQQIDLRLIRGGSVTTLRATIAARP
jgi:S1-C subfamily serine protease